MKKSAVAVLVGFVMAIFAGCGGGGGTPNESSVTSDQQTISYVGTYKGTIGTILTDSFVIAIDSQNSIAGVYNSGNGIRTLLGTLNGNSITATASNGDSWEGKISDGKITINIHGTSGTTTASGTLSTDTTPVKVTSPLTPKVLFSSAMLSGKAMTVYFKNSYKVYTFSANGTLIQAGGTTGTWVINSDGTLTISTPSEVLTFAIESNAGTTYSYKYINATTPTVAEGPYIFYLP